MERWCNDNGMWLNVDKCKTVRFSTSNSPVNTVYNLFDRELDTVNDMDDLGVTFSSNGSFKNHIERVTNKACRVLGFINRSLLSINPITYKLLYNALVRPIVEYASPVWSPYYKTEINTIERVQHRFLRRIAYLNRTPMTLFEHDYSVMQCTFDVKTLETRRKHSDMFLLYSIVHGKVNSVDLSECFSYYEQPRSLRRNYIFNVKRSHSLRHQSSVVNRLMTLGNQLGLRTDWRNLHFATFKRFLSENLL